MRRRAVLAALALIGSLALIAATSFAGAETLTAEIGARLFKRAWVPAPASTTANDGLGPHFDARACAACHPAGGRAPGGPELIGFSIRLDLDGAPDPRLGRILQGQATAGVAAEGLARRVAGTGRLKVIAGTAPIAPDPRTRISARLAPTLRGGATFERIDPAAILAQADPDDRDGDGISGRAAMLPGPHGPRLGLYGWKASHARLSDQIEAAFAHDMGMSTARFPDPHGDCTAWQADCRNAPHGASADGPEVAPAIIEALGAYLATLTAPPAKDDATGAALFASIGCARCHTPTLPMREGGVARVFSDLLLHDLGPDLAGDAEPGVGAREWRTAPLIDLGAATSGYLHDGRAATLEAAILAHGGEAEGARARYRAAGPTERGVLLAYLKRL